MKENKQNIIYEKENENKKMKIEIIRSRRKTMVLEITKDGRIFVRAPYGASEKEIWNFVKEKKLWLEKHQKMAEERIKRQKEIPKLTEKEVQKLTAQAQEIIPKRVDFYASKMKINYGRITIKKQKTRWGSCSAKGNLNFNCLLALAPPEILDYVVVHELCHRKEMNHSVRFWTEVEKILPDYRKRRKWLKENGSDLMARLFS